MNFPNQNLSESRDMVINTGSDPDFVRIPFLFTNFIHLKNQEELFPSSSKSVGQTRKSSLHITTQIKRSHNSEVCLLVTSSPLKNSRDDGTQSDKKSSGSGQTSDVNTGKSKRLQNARIPRPKENEFAQPTERVGYLSDSDSRYEFNHIELYADSKENSPGLPKKLAKVEKSAEKQASGFEKTKKVSSNEKKESAKNGSGKKNLEIEKSLATGLKAQLEKTISPRGKGGNGSFLTPSNQNLQKKAPKTSSFLIPKAKLLESTQANSKKTFEPAFAISTFQ